jgi:hypothetical protein
LLADTTRAEFIRLQCAFAQAESHAIFLAHGWRWSGLDSQPRDWTRTAAALCNGFTDAEARELARAPNLGRLAQLDLTGNVIGEVGREALAARFGSSLVL